MIYSISLAGGQAPIGVFFDVIDFIIVFLIWLFSVLVLIQINRRLKLVELSKFKRRVLWISTGLVALFVWSMVKHDGRPYEGPIDSLFKSKSTFDSNEPQPDGTIETCFQSEDSTELGVYRWENGEKIFIRKLNENEKE